MKKKILPVLLVIVLIFVVGGVTFGEKIIEKYSYSREKADLKSYLGITGDDEVAILMGDELVEEKARLVSATCYFDFPTVEKYFTDRFYVNLEEQVLLFTTNTDVIRINIGDSSDVIYTSDIGNSLDYKAAVIIDDVLYIAANYLKNYVNFDYSLYDSPMRVQVNTKWEPYTEATILKDTALRVKGGIKSEIVKEVSQGEKVVVLDEMETWSKVKSGDSLIGYVENKFLKGKVTAQGMPVNDVKEIVYDSVTKEGIINMAFHQVFDNSANNLPKNVLKGTKGVNVLAPTWFRLSDNEGHFVSIASKDYVNQAHDMGVDVWALITDVDSSEQFGVDIDFYEILSSSVNRRTLINGLMEQVDTYGIDGINIDFEKVRNNAGTHFVQFLRELSIETRKRQVVLSVDNYVPTEYTAHYNRKEQGIVADYLVVMGYDEYYSGNGQAGPNASISYVEMGIQKTKEVVPENKIINAIPFYTRVWESTPEGLKSSTLTMSNQKSWIKTNNVSPIWLDEYCQYYAEFQNSNGNTVQCWLEDVESIKVKLQVMKTQKIAGVAHWKLGLEDKEVWDVIEQYANGMLE